MGDFTKCRSSADRDSGAGAGAEGTAGAGGAAAGPGTMISGAANIRCPATETAGDGFFNRIRKSPREYSNSSRLCSLMTCRSCSMCSSSVLANFEFALGAEGFLGLMPVLNLYKVPREAGQHFRTLGVHHNVIFNANPADSRYVNAGLNGNYGSGCQNLLLSPGYPRILMHLQP